ncbi:hypothetical protein LG34_15925 [Eubacterium ramulus]|uniref:YcxB-like protein domain-containing protein n=1 Tax=Eubacterium ramulus TaxID=39490 RepID=A0A2V1JN10_EUBRA|nr:MULTISPECIES: YcxB family protein [Clostridia]PWE85439.1 hypothetical protein LG34_15925 [Eubacterium ramulus]RHV63867.1 YcxB family protein [Roseburia sp. OM02-15]
MDALYNIDSTVTWNEYKRFCKVVRKSNNKRKTFTCVCLIIVLLLSILLIKVHVYYPTALAILILLVGYLTGFVKQRNEVKRAWNTNKAMQNSVHHYLFYNEYLEDKTSTSMAELAYNKIHRIMITDTNIYIMSGAIQGLVISKENCNEEFLSFISSIKEKYHV